MSTKSPLAFPLAVVSGLALVVACAAPQTPPEAAAGEAARSAVIILARHGEATPPPYQNDPPNPHLSETGLRRAADLAHALRDVDVDRILSTDLHRTRETAAPLAEALGLEIEVYNADHLAGLADELRASSGITFVSGHSNTTPRLVGLIGGEPGGEIDHRWEYDRLYCVMLAGGEVERTLLLRYGEKSDPATVDEGASVMGEP